MDNDQTQAKTTRPRRHWRVLLALVLIGAAIVTLGVLPRLRAATRLRREAHDGAETRVLVQHPRRASAASELILPANVRAFVEAPIFARTNGYLRRWYFDIGARVKKGALLAEIDTPEVDQQLRQGRADLATARANLDLSRITARRYGALLRTDSVSRQDADNAAGDLAARKALVRSAQANVRRLQELQSFQRVHAPFDGVVTARNTDVGALITAGTAGAAGSAGGAGSPAISELFHVAQPETLRVFINVPESYAAAARTGLAVDLTVAALPGRRFRGTVARTANAIDLSTRTLLTEVSVNNPAGILLPGAFAEVHLKLAGAAARYLVPVSALLFRAEGLRVALVADDQRAALRKIIVGRDLGAEVEVTAGLNGDETLIVNPPDSLLPGQPVRIVAKQDAEPAGPAHPPSRNQE